MKEKFKYIVFAAVLLIPFLYSFFYLKSYWDPYGNMDNIPVAIVNLDKGNKGSSVTKNLIDSKVLKFKEVDSSKAQKGLINKDYYAVITIPKDFTKNLESAKEEDKIPAMISYSPNQKSNYLASQIINRVVLNVEKEVRSTVSKEVVNNLSEKLDEVPNKLEEVSDGAQKIEDGAETLSAGLNTLNNGINSLNSNYTKIDDGVYSLKSGINTLNTGVKQINSALNEANTDNISTLVNGINELNEGAESLNSGINEYVNGTELLAGGVKQLNQNISMMINQYQTLYENAVSSGNMEDALKYGTAVSTLQTLKSNEGFTSLVNGANTLTDTSTYGVTQGTLLKSGAAKLNSGTSILNNNTSSIQNIGSSINSLKENLAKVEEGTNNLESGVDSLKTGSTSVKSALNQLSSGSLSLNSGSQKLVAGLDELKTSVVNGAETTKEELKKLEDLDKFTANPVEIEEKDEGKVSTYGVSFLPLFISIGLWVGALMSYVVLYFDQEHRFKILDKENRGIKQNMYYLLVAVLLGLITAFLVKNLLHFKVTSVFTYYFASILISATFMSIVQLLIRVFGDIGKFLALIILVLQLASSGGTFPVETIDKSFRIFTNFLPMTYSINLIKETVISKDSNFTLTNIGILLLFLVVSVTVTTIYDLRKTKKSN